MPQSLPDILFAVAAAAVVLLSLSVVLARNPVRSTLLLILSFVPVSGIYILLNAAFVGVLQVLVYAGAILMLFTFVIMMINPEPTAGEIPGETGAAMKARRWKGDLVILLLLAASGFMLIAPVRYVAGMLAPGAPAQPGFGGIQSLSRLMFSDPAENPLTVSFELISFLILAGVIASINFSRRDRAPASSSEDQNA
jgi:NADH-quinone oxidoreductase subunit J